MLYVHAPTVASDSHHFICPKTKEPLANIRQCQGCEYNQGEIIHSIDDWRPYLTSCSLAKRLEIYDPHVEYDELCLEDIHRDHFPSDVTYHGCEDDFGFPSFFRDDL